MSKKNIILVTVAALLAALIFGSVLGVWAVNKDHRDSCVDAGVMVIDNVTFDCNVKSVKISNSVHWVLPEAK